VERLVLWDIDRTLVAVTANYFLPALSAATGRQLRDAPEMGGRTDRAIISRVLALQGIAVTEELLEACYAGLAAAAHERAAEMRENGQALPGAAAALAAMAGFPGVVQTVVTGNIAPVARQKLSLFELAHHIDFEIGGYGSESLDRREMVGLARERAQRKHGRRIAAGSVVVVGDTPHDIAGARESGVIAVGVASGSSKAEDLWAAGAHAVLPSLADTSAVVAAIMRPAG
jgi:phosphoglycolate phosphatase-like HAD superfamily hydrolase